MPEYQVDPNEMEVKKLMDIGIMNEIEGREFPTAKAVVGTPGWVLSPYTGHHVRVYGIPAGALVNDPDFPIQEEKYFRVPEVPASEEPER